MEQRIAFPAAFDRGERVLGQLLGACDRGEFAQRVLDCGFDPARYLGLNKDLQEFDLDTAQAFGHFLLAGFREPRRVPAGSLLQGLSGLSQLPLAHRHYQVELVQAMWLAQMKSEAGSGELWQGLQPGITQALVGLKGRPFVVVGDSHSDLYVRRDPKPDHWLAPVLMLCTGGSATGLARPGSKSQYGTRILRWAAASDEAAKSHPVFFKFGQVDAEFVFMFRRVRDGRRDFQWADFDAFADESVAGYRQFLAQFLAQGSIRPWVCSIFPPSLSDAAWRKGYVNAHIGFLEGDRSLDELSAGIAQLEIPDLATRTAMHASYNERLKVMAESLGLEFVDDFAPLVGEGPTIRPEFLQGHDGGDHHLPFGPLEPVLTPIVVDAQARHARGGLRP